MKNIVVTINGKKISSPPGTTILAAAERNAISIPTLCSHAELAPYGACRICLVEDRNTGRLMASCVTPVAQDMNIATDSDRVREHRKNIVRLMIAEHPESCIVCSKGNRCELRKAAAELGVAETRLYPMPNYKPFETLNPFIARDLSKCILCGKCIRADHELVAVGAIDYSDRGFSSRPATLYGRPLEESVCTFCGTCVSMCPTGALSTRSEHYAGTPEKEAYTVCGFCGAGCSMAVGVSGGRVVEINPSEDKNTVNGPTLCVRGHFAHDFLLSEDRLTTPLIRKKNEDGTESLQTATFDDALSSVVGRIADIKRHHGPESIGFIGSAKCTNEENYLFQKIARVIFETNNVTNCQERNGAALLRRIDEKTGGAARITPLSGLEKAEAIVVVGTDPEHTVPVAGYHIRRAVRNKTPMVVIDPSRSGMASFGGLWLHPENNEEGGRDAFRFAVDALGALATSIASENGADSQYIGSATEDPDGWIDSLSRENPDAHARAAGIDAAKIRKAASMLVGKKIALVLPPDLLERQFGNQTFDAAFNLALLTGSIGVQNAGLFVFTLENNTAGALDMGCAPDLLPGRRNAADPDERKIVEKAWEKALPETAGMGLLEMIEAAEAGTLKALYIMGENPLRSLPNPERIAAALEKLEFIVVQDIVRTRTAEIADVVLPAAAFSEKQGSFTNTEGRIQSFGPAAQPPGDSLPDWNILASLARKAGYPEQYTTIEKIRQEIRRIAPLYAAMGSHRREWLKKSDTGGSKRFCFAPPPGPEKAQKDDSFPLTAYIGNLRWHLGSGSRTARSGRISAGYGAGRIGISRTDAESLGIAIDDLPVVRITSATGSIERQAEIFPGLPAGFVFVPSGFSGNDAMRIADFNAAQAGGENGGQGWRTVRVRMETS